MNADNSPLLMYLPHDDKKNQIAEPNHLRRWTLEYVREIKRKFGIQLSENDLAKRMCIALNKSLFTLTKVTHQSVVTKRG